MIYIIYYDILWYMIFFYIAMIYMWYYVIILIIWQYDGAYMVNGEYFMMFYLYFELWIMVDI